MIQQQNSSDRLVRLCVLLGEVLLIALMMAALYAVYWHQIGGFPPHFLTSTAVPCSKCKWQEMNYLLKIIFLNG